MNVMQGLAQISASQNALYRKFILREITRSEYLRQIHLLDKHRDALELSVFSYSSSHEDFLKTISSTSLVANISSSGA